MSAAAEQFLARFKTCCALEPELASFSDLVGAGGGLALPTLLAAAPVVMVRMQSAESVAELLHALGRAYNRATEDQAT